MLQAEMTAWRHWSSCPHQPLPTASSTCTCWAPLRVGPARPTANIGAPAVPSPWPCAPLWDMPSPWTRRWMWHYWKSSKPGRNYLPWTRPFPCCKGCSGRTWALPGLHSAESLAPGVGLCGEQHTHQQDCGSAEAAYSEGNCGQLWQCQYICLEQFGPYLPPLPHLALWLWEPLPHLAVFSGQDHCSVQLFHLHLLQPQGLVQQDLKPVFWEITKLWKRYSWPNSAPPRSLGCYLDLDVGCLGWTDAHKDKDPGTGSETGLYLMKWPFVHTKFCNSQVDFQENTKDQGVQSLKNTFDGSFSWGSCEHLSLLI